MLGYGMTPTELAGGEDSTLEFKRDDVRNHDLAKELVAFLNLEGGAVLLGVDDDGSIAAHRTRRAARNSNACSKLLGGT